MTYLVKNAPQVIIYKTIYMSDVWKDSLLNSSKQNLSDWNEKKGFANLLWFPMSSAMGREMGFGSSVGRKDARGLLTGKLFGIQRASDQTTMGLSRMSIACSDALGIVFMLTSGDNACLQGRSVKQVPEVGAVPRVCILAQEQISGLTCYSHPQLSNA